jgi:hypothetical protein
MFRAKPVSHYEVVVVSRLRVIAGMILETAGFRFD